MDEFKKRRTPRCQGFNYNDVGAYFITICTKNKRCILSRIVGTGVLDCPKIELTRYGEIADKYIQQLNNFYDYLSVEGYVIMPNHIHLLLWIKEKKDMTDNGQSGTPVPTNVVEESGCSRTPVPTNVMEESGQSRTPVPTNVMEESGQSGTPVPTNVVEESGQSGMPVPTNVVEESRCSGTPVPTNVVEESGRSGMPVPTNVERANNACSQFVSTFKRFCNKEYGENIWQGRFNDHIIRNQDDYEEHVKYIYENPVKWFYDELYTNL